MTPEEVESVARQAAQEALAGFASEIQEAADRGVTAALERVGIDPDDPTAVQRDLAFLRDWRTTTAGMRKKGLVTAAGVIVVGALGALWLGIKALILGD